MEIGKALQIIDQNQGRSLVFARKEEIQEISPQFEPIVTVLEFQQNDFAAMGGGNHYPLKSAQNRIADATGVSFTKNCGTREVGNFYEVQIEQAPEGYFYAKGNYAVIGYAQGQRLKPDGAPRLSSVCEYEFNVVDRANEDFLSDFEKNKYIKNPVSARKKLLSLKKFATRRASTGAELAVVRELAGVPTAFKADQIRKPLVFSQVVENNKFKLQVANDLMKHPDGRQAVANAMFGNTQTLYGPQGGEVPKALQAAEAQEAEVFPTDEDDAFGDFEPPVTAETETISERESIIMSLEEYKASGILPPSGLELVNAAIENEANYTEEQLNDLLQRCRNVESRRENGGAA